jgi:hypothetical protein
MHFTGDNIPKINMMHQHLPTKLFQYTYQDLLTLTISDKTHILGNKEKNNYTRTFLQGAYPFFILVLTPFVTLYSAYINACE